MSNKEYTFRDLYSLFDESYKEELFPVENVRQRWGSAYGTTSPQQPVTHSSPPRVEAEGTEKRVCDDIAKRQHLGISKYGVTVEQNPLSLLQWMKHEYEEQLDAVVYKKRQIEELEKIIALSEQYSNPQTQKG